MIILTPGGKYKFEARDNDPDDEVVVRETWVDDVYQLHRGLLDDTGIVIDIGANIGAVSVFCAAMSKDQKDEDEASTGLPPVKVFAVEPEPHNLVLLKQNISLNNMTDQITVIDKAIWGSRGSLMVNNDSGGSVTLLPGDKLVEQDSIAVEAIRLEDLYADNKIANCDLLKLDVEGAEYEILLGAPDHILTKAAHIRLEFDERTKNHMDLFGQLVTQLCRFYNVRIIGSPERGGNIYADRYEK